MKGQRLNLKGFLLAGFLFVGSFTSAYAQVLIFNNGCSRTCTGNWSYNSSTCTYACDGTAGALSCPAKTSTGHENRANSLRRSSVIETEFTPSGSPSEIMSESLENIIHLEDLE